MTEMGYKNLIDEIRRMTITPPDDFTTEQLQAWMLGYGQAYSEIIKLIDSYIDHER